MKMANQKTTPMSDGLINKLTGQGTDRSKRSHFVWSYENINNYSAYEAAYQTSWIARRICDAVAADMTKMWREIKSGKADEIRSEEDRLMVPAKFSEAVRYARLYGGAAIIPITDQDLRQPLDVRKIKKGDLKRLLVLDRWYVTGADINVMDVLDEDFNLPSEYYVNNSKALTVHKSHVIRVIGEPLPIRLAFQSQGWGDSSLRQAMETVEDFLSSIGGVAESLQEFNVDTIRKDGLMDEIGTDQEDRILARFRAWGMMKSIFRVSLLDGNEQFERNQLTYSGVADMIELMMKMVSGASNIPMTKLFGDSAKGLNATGEGDEKTYFDYISAQQAAKLDPALRKLDEILVRSAIGEFPNDFNYSWNPLSIPSENEIATANKVQADADIAYLEANVITVSQIQRNLQSKEKYQFDPARIDELERLENEVPMEELLNEENSGDAGAGEGIDESAQENAGKGVPAKNRGEVQEKPVSGS